MPRLSIRQHFCTVGALSVLMGLMPIAVQMLFAGNTANAASDSGAQFWRALLASSSGEADESLGSKIVHATWTAGKWLVLVSAMQWVRRWGLTRFCGLMRAERGA